MTKDDKNFCLPRSKLIGKVSLNFFIFFLRKKVS